jgi:hypothetical protein
MGTGCYALVTVRPYFAIGIDVIIIVQPRRVAAGEGAAAPNEVAASVTDMPPTPFVMQVTLVVAHVTKLKLRLLGPADSGGVI